MHRFLLTGGLCLALGACAATPIQPLPSCNGQHRRPANPNGSVLLSADTAAKPAPPANAKPGPESAASFVPCGSPS